MNERILPSAALALCFGLQVMAAPVPKSLKKESESARIWRKSGLPPTKFPEIDPDATLHKLPEVKEDDAEIAVTQEQQQAAVTIRINKRFLSATVRQIDILHGRLALEWSNAGTLHLGQATQNLRGAACGAFNDTDELRPWLVYAVQLSKRLELEEARTRNAGDEIDEKLLKGLTADRIKSEDALIRLDEKPKRGK